MTSAFFKTFLAVASVISALTAAEDSRDYITILDIADYRHDTPTCRQEYYNTNVSPQCVTEQCTRRVTDGLFSDDDMLTLHSIAEKGMSTRPALGGPTILDINTGITRDLH